MYSESAVGWLSDILTERFGINLSLICEAHQWSLSVEGLSGKIIINSTPDIFDGAGADTSLKWYPQAEDWSSPISDHLVVPCVATLPSPLINHIDNCFYIHYDIIGLAYWILSRTEEVGRKDLDIHGRFPASNSHAYRHGYLDRPIVDEWLVILGQVIGHQWPGLPLKSGQFSVLPTHDVDAPAMYAFCSGYQLLRMTAGHLLKRKDLVAAVKAPWIWANSRSSIHPSDPYNTFDWLMNLSEKAGINSAFYFICGRTDAKRDALYEVESPKIRALMRSIHRRGHEIGLHPSYDTYLRPDLIMTEASRLRMVCEQEGITQNKWGGRMHYLRWKSPDTLLAWQGAGMDYDSTLTYADFSGFRSGTCWEYPGFDPVHQIQLSVRVRPLVMMECSIIDSLYMGLGDTEGAVDYMVKLKDRCRSVKGNFSILWHNSYLLTERHRDMYMSILSA